MVEFTETFTVQKVNTTDWATYRQFIESLRGKTQLLYRRTRNKFPILHPEAKDPTKDKWFDILLKTSNGAQVRLRIRRSNLYLDGFQNRDGEWLEFKNDSGKYLIPGSTFMGFKGNYDSLENKENNRGNILLGWKELEGAVNTLASYKKGKEVSKRALLIVIQMICESTRFKSVLKQLSKYFQDESAKDNKARVAPVKLIAQENKWGDICEELLHTDSDPTHRFKPPSPDTEIKNATDAWDAIGMLKYYKFPKTRGLFGDMVAASVSDGEEYPEGQGQPVEESSEDILSWNN